MDSLLFTLQIREQLNFPQRFLANRIAALDTKTFSKYNYIILTIIKIILDSECE